MFMNEIKYMAEAVKKWFIVQFWQKPYGTTKTTDKQYNIKHTFSLWGVTEQVM
jgi:hypothetical protein